MKIYLFQPKGYGEASFATCAENEIEAFERIDVYIKERLKDTKNSLPLYTINGWGTDYYEVIEKNVNEVIETF